MNFTSQRRTLPPLHNTMKTRAGNRECCYKLQSLMGDSVIIRCIYKPGTTFPARLLSITSHHIAVPCQICQLTLALLIKWTTRGRWTERKQLVIFPAIISLFGSLHLAPSLCPQHRGEPRNCTCGEKRSKSGREEGQNLLKASSVAFSISGKSYYCLQREGGRWQCCKDQQKTPTTSFPILTSSSSSLPCFARLGKGNTTKIHRHLQLLPLSLLTFSQF